jgi:hypothetical protein
MEHSPDDLLTRDATAQALTRAGLVVSAVTLATKATRGGGPSYRLFGRRPLYKWSDALAWAQGKLSDPISNSSERDVAASSEEVS